MADAARLVLLNGLLLVFGAGVAGVTRIGALVGSPIGLVGAAYMLGVATGGIVLAHAALVGLVPGLVGGVALAAAGAAAALWRRRAFRLSWRRPTVGDVFGGLLLTAALALLAYAARVFADRPLLEWDGWAIWALKARAIYDAGGVDTPVLQSDAYSPFHLDYPLLLPALEANGFAAMGGFTGTTIHLQLALLGLGFAAALWGLLRRRVPPELAGIGIAALVFAPPLVPQLSSNYADVPLAFFVALGVVSLALWVKEGSPAYLACAAIFLGAAALTKNEGALFAVAALLAAGAASRSVRDRPVRGIAVVAAAVVAAVAPWRAYAAAAGLRDDVYRFSSLVDPAYLAVHADRVPPTLEAIVGQFSPAAWGGAVALLACGIGAAVLAHRREDVVFAAVWMAVSLLGLTAVYWISRLPIEGHLEFSVDRTVASLVLGSGAIAPLLMADVWRDGIATLRGAAGRPRR